MTGIFLGCMCVKTVTSHGRGAAKGALANAMSIVAKDQRSKAVAPACMSVRTQQITAGLTLSLKLASGESDAKWLAKDVLSGAMHIASSGVKLTNIMCAKVDRLHFRLHVWTSVDF